MARALVLLLTLATACASAGGQFPPDVATAVRRSRVRAAAA